MTQQQLNLLAAISVIVCWAAFAATWLAAENYNESRAPAERTRSWFGTAVVPGAVVITVINLAVPKADWRSLTFSDPPGRLLGLVILLAATAFTIWSRLVLGVMWSGAPTVKQQHELRTTGPYGITRHPIYTGILGMLIGSLLVTGAGRWLAPVPGLPGAVRDQDPHRGTVHAGRSSRTSTRATASGYPSWCPACG